jgi:hypothetical protein
MPLAALMFQLVKVTCARLLQPRVCAKSVWQTDRDRRGETRAPKSKNFSDDLAMKRRGGELSIAAFFCI